MRKVRHMMTPLLQPRNEEFRLLSEQLLRSRVAALSPCDKKLGSAFHLLEESGTPGTVDWEMTSSSSPTSNA